MSPATPATACAHCRFWQEEPNAPDARIGICRRLPPAYEGWPMTSPADWCGEFRGQGLD